MGRHKFVFLALALAFACLPGVVFPQSANALSDVVATVALDLGSTMTVEDVASTGEPGAVAVELVSSTTEVSTSTTELVAVTTGQAAAAGEQVVTIIGVVTSVYESVIETTADSATSTSDFVSTTVESSELAVSTAETTSTVAAATVIEPATYTTVVEGAPSLSDSFVGVSVSTDRGVCVVNESVKVFVSAGGVSFDLWVREPSGWLLVVQNSSGDLEYLYATSVPGDYSVRVEFFGRNLSRVLEEGFVVSLPEAAAPSGGEAGKEMVLGLARPVVDAWVGDVVYVGFEAGGSGDLVVSSGEGTRFGRDVEFLGVGCGEEDFSDQGFVLLDLGGDFVYAAVPFLILPMSFVFFFRRKYMRHFLREGDAFDWGEGDLAERLLEYDAVMGGHDRSKAKKSLRSLRHDYNFDSNWLRREHRDFIGRLLSYDEEIERSGKSGRDLAENVLVMVAVCLILGFFLLNPYASKPADEGLLSFYLNNQSYYALPYLNYTGSGHKMAGFYLPNYGCSDEGFVKLKALSPGSHSLDIWFSGEVARVTVNVRGENATEGAQSSGANETTVRETSGTFSGVSLSIGKTVYQINETVNITVSAGDFSFDLWISDPSGWVLALQNYSGGVTYNYVSAVPGDYAAKAEFFAGNVSRELSLPFRVVSQLSGSERALEGANLYLDKEVYYVNESVVIHLSAENLSFDLWINAPTGWFFALQNQSGSTEYVYTTSETGDYEAEADFYSGNETRKIVKPFRVVSGNETNASFSVQPLMMRQGPVVIGEPVNWTQDYIVTVLSDSGQEVCLPLPVDAFDLKVWGNGGLMSVGSCVNLSSGNYSLNLSVTFKTSPVELVVGNVSELNLSEVLPPEAFDITIFQDGEVKQKAADPQSIDLTSLRSPALFRQEITLRQNSSLPYENISIDLVALGQQQETASESGKPGELSVGGRVGNRVLGFAVGVAGRNFSVRDSSAWPGRQMLWENASDGKMSLEVDRLENNRTLVLESDVERVQGRATVGEKVNWTLYLENLTVAYSTSEPTSAQEEPVLSDGKWVKKVNIESNASVHYVNISAHSAVEERPGAPIRLFWLVNGSRVDVTAWPEYNVSLLDGDGNGIADGISWNVPELSNQSFEIEATLTVLNLHSYPPLYGNWTVMFNTTGTADLWIAAYNETTWNNVNETGDLLFLELRCGETVLSYEWVNDSVYVVNYSCADLGYETSKELTVGEHTLEFRFGDVTKYAYNTVSNVNFTAPTEENGTTITRNWTQVNITASVTSANLDTFKFNWNGTNYSIYDNSLVLALNLNNNSLIGESSSKAVDISPQGNNGTISGPVWNDSGRFGSSLKFSGSGSMDFSSSLDSVEITIMAWIYSNNSNTLTNTIIANRAAGCTLSSATQGYEFSVNSWATDDRKLGFEYANTSSSCNGISSSAGLVPKNQWVFVAASVSNVTHIVKLYMNGEEVANGSIIKMPAANNAKIGIMSNQAYFYGKMDEVWIYNRALSSQEVWLHYQSEFQKYNSTEYRFYTNLTNLTTGIYTYYGWANDSAGNSNYTNVYSASSPRYLFVDFTAPVVRLAAPGNNTVWSASGNVSFIFNVSDSSSISFCNLSVDGAASQSMASVAKDVNQTFNVSLSEGAHNWSVNCTDAGGLNGFSGVFNVNVSVAPVLNFSAPTEENGTTISRNWTQVNISISEPNLDTFKFNWNGTNYSIYDDSLVLALNFNNNSGIGENYNNSNGTRIMDASKYGYNGTLYVGAAGSGNYTTGRFGGAYNFNGVSDYIDLSAYASTFDTLATGTTMGWFRDGPKTIQVIYYLCDSASTVNVASVCLGDCTAAYTDESLSVGIVTGGTDRIIASVRYGNTYYMDQQWHHFAVVVGTNYNKVYVDGQEQTLSYYKGSAATGNYFLNVVNGNSFMLARRNLTGYDSVYLNGSIDEFRIYNRSLTAQDVRLQYQTEFQKYNSTTYRFYSNLTNLSDGTYTYYGWANDSLGNSAYTSTYSASSPRYLFVDFTAPVVRLAAPGNNTVWSASGNVSFIFNVSDSSSISFCNLSVDGAASQSMASVAKDVNQTFNVSLSEGAHNWSVNCTDAGGLNGFSGVFNVNVSVAPVLNFSAPTEENGTTIARNWTQANISISESNLNTFKFNWNGTNYSIYDDSLVLAYNFNNNSAIGDSPTLAVDSSKYGRNGTVTGLWNVSGRFGGGLTLNSTTDSVNLTPYVSAFSGYSVGSVEGWFRANTKALQMLVAVTDKDTLNDYMELMIGDCTAHYSDESLTFVFTKGGTTYIDANVRKGTTYYIDNRWHYFAVVVGSNFNNIYIDGEQMSVTYYTGSSSTGGYLFNINNADSLYIGRRLFTGYDSVYFNGTIDEFRIYNRSLSAQEVWLHYQSEFSKYNSTEYRFYANLTNLSDGTYTYYGWANDSLGNSAYTNTYTASSPRYLFVDMSAPVVRLAAPGNNTVWSAAGNVSFIFNVSDSSSISYCNLSVDGAASQSMASVAKDVNQTFNVSLGEGAHNWSVNCTDAAGLNGFSGFFNVNVSVVPVLNFSAPTEENGTIITRNWTQANISVNEQNLDTFKFNWNGTNYSIYDDSLVLALNFNNNSAIGENATKAVDISKYGNNGTLYNANWSVYGRFGGGVSVGDGGQVVVPDSPVLSPPYNLTVSLWFNATKVDFKNVSAGGSHSCGVLVNGSAMCWGYGSSGRLGNGSTSNSSVPVFVSGGYNFSSVSAGDEHSCGVLVNGSAMCWGYGGYGRLGNGSDSTSYVPVFVSGGYNFSSVSAGGSHSCGVLVNGSAMCWGYGAYYQLGNGSTSDSSVPVFVSGGYNFSSVSAGSMHSCGVLVNGSAMCWGSGGYYQLGDGSTDSNPVPGPVSGGNNFSSVSAGSTHSCGVLVGGSAKCWGSGSSGKLGNGGTNDMSTPYSVSGGYSFSSVSAGGRHSCGVLVNGSAMCWGSGDSGRLGNGGTSQSNVPVFVSGDYNFSSVSAGNAFSYYTAGSHNCGRLVNGSVMCWGNGSSGRLGNGGTSDRSFPVLVVRGVLLGKSPQSYALYGGYGGYVAASAENNSVPSYVLQGWHHAAFTYDSEGNLNLYIDGSSVGSRVEALGHSLYAESINVSVGAVLGVYDEARIYNRSLSAQEIWLHYQTEFQKYNSTTYLFYSNVTNLSEGTYTYYGWANDSLGNSAYTNTYTASSPRYLFVDMSAPVVRLAAPGNNTVWSTAGNVSFIFNVSDSSSVSFCNLSVDGAASQSMASVVKDMNQTFNVSLSEGAHNWSVNCTDAGGVNGFSGFFNVNVSVVPVLNFSAPTEENGTTIARNWTQANISINEQNLNTFIFDWNGTNYSIYDDSLVLALNFNNNSAIGENSTRVVDSSKYGNNGTVYGGAAWNSSGRFGGAYNFDGGDDYVGVPDSGSLNFIDRITLAAWANLQPAAVLNISVGYYHSCALLSGGSVLCWGRNNYGQLGDGTTTSSSLPVPVSGGNVFSQISLGEYHSCGVLVNGSVLCWGYDNYGQLGNGSSSSSNAVTPVAVSGDFNFSGVGLGGSHSCGVLVNGSVLCWGYNYYGRLGNGNTSDMYYPVALSGVYNFSGVGLGNSHSCGRLFNGSVLCWGSNLYGQLGIGVDYNRNKPVLVRGGNTFSKMGSGGCTAYHSCGVLVNGSAMCWGSNGNGQLGNGNTSSMSYPVALSGVYNFSSVSLGGSYSCGVLVNGSAMCWGSNGNGQLGNGNISEMRYPVFVSGGYNFSSVSAGGAHSCGVLVNGSVLCWGWNVAGQLGNGNISEMHYPVALSGVYNFLSVSLGNTHSCGVLVNGSVLCWGSNTIGELGNGNTSSMSYPVALSGVYNFSSVGGGSHSCGVLFNGSVLCWGRDNYGQLGNGNTSQMNYPVALSGVYNFTNLSVGYYHSCGRLVDGSVLCWGYNNYGQLGLEVDRLSPVEAFAGMVLGRSSDTWGVASTFGRGVVAFIGSLDNNAVRYDASGGWRHLVLAYEQGSSLRLYVDGLEVGSSIPQLSVYNQQTDVLVGRCTRSSVDEVRVWNRALSAQEVWLYYQTEFAKHNSTEYRFYANVTNLSSGTYTYYGWANDSAGNSAYTNTYTASSPRYLFIDFTAPVVRLAAPGNNTVWSALGNVSFTFNVSDSSSISFCNLSVDGAASQSMASVAKDVNQSFNVSLSNGLYNWSVNCTDAAGNNGFSGVFNVSVSIPSFNVSLNSPANMTVTSDNSSDYNFTVLGNMASYSCILYLNGVNKGSNTSVLNNTGTVITSSEVSDGVYVWQVNCSYAATFNQSAIRTITIDATAPALNFSSPTAENGTTITINSTQVNISVSEASTNLSAFIFNWNGANYSIYDDSLVLAYNFNNNSAVGENYNNSIGMKIVDISRYGNNGTTVSTAESPVWNSTGRFGGAMQFDGSDDYVDTGTYFPSLVNNFSIGLWVNPGSSQVQYADIFGNHGGTYKGMVFQQDSNSLNNYYFAYGTGAAWVSSSNLQLATSVWQQVAVVKNTVNCSIYLNGNLNTTFSCSSPVSPNSALNFMLGRGYATGRAFTGKIDEVRIYSRALSAQEVWLHYQTEFQKYNSTTYLFYSNVTNLSEGTYTYYGWANDSLGNSAYTNTYTATSPRYLFVDFTAPVVRLAAPGNNTTWTAVGNLSFIYNVSDYSSISFCNLSINGVVNQSTTSVPKDVNQTFNVSLPNGLYNWSVNCTDAAGNNGFSGAFNVSVSIPSFNVSLNSPANMTVTSDNSSDYNFTVLGNMASYSCILYLNGVNRGSNASVLNNTGTVITSSEVSDGVYVWQVNCSYAATFNQSAIRTITIDATAPALNFSSPTAENGTTITINSTQVNISVSEASTNLSSFIFNWNGTNYSIYDDSLMLALNLNNNSAIGDSSTKAVDISKYSYNGSITGATWNVSGRFGSCLSFDGNDYVDAGSANTFNPGTGPVTWMAWFKTTGGGYQEIMDVLGGSGWVSDGDLSFWVVSGYLSAYYSVTTSYYSATVTSSSLVNDSVWHHGALVWNYSSKTMELFLDGASQGTNTNNNINSYTISTQSGRTFSIGCQHYASGNRYFFNGQIDEVKIYKRLLSAQEIWLHYQTEFQKYNSTEYRFYSNLTNLSDGTYTYYGWANDSLNNGGYTNTYSAAGPRYLSVDRSAPSTSASAVKNDSSSYAFGSWTDSSYVNVSLSCSDAVGSCDKTVYCTDTANSCTPTTAYSVPVQVSTEGVSYIRYRSNDTFGNNESVNSQTIRLDYSNPVLNFSSPTEENGTAVTTNWTQVNISINELGLDVFRFDWNGTNYSIYDDSLVLALNFNNNSAIGENATKAVDISKYGNNATFKGSEEPNWTLSGRYGSALQFDGVDDYVSVQDSASLDVSGNITVMAWAKDPVNWWNGSWGYRRQINVSNIAENLSYYQVNISLNATPLYEAGKLNSTCKDVRFTYYNATTGAETLLNFWTENCTTNSNATLSVFWVNVTYLQNNTNTTMYVYYGNPSAASASNGTKAFDFFDDFNDDDISDWTIVGNTVSAVSGQLRTYSASPSTSSYPHAYSTYSFSGNGILEADMQLGSGTVNLAEIQFFWSTSTGTRYGSRFESRAAYWDEFIKYASDSSWAELGSYTGHVTSQNVWHKMKVVIKGTNFTEYNDGTLVASAVDSSYTSGRVGITAWKDYSYFDNIRVRKYASPEPVFLLDSEEQPPKMILSKEGAYSLKMSASGSTLYGRINAQEASAAVSTPVEWHQYAMTYNSSRIALYIDGMEAGSASASGSINTNDNNVLIGDRFNGTIDEVRIYNRALSAQEIWLHYQSEFAKYNSTTYRFYSNLTNLSEGTYTYYGWANDSLGNSAYTNTYTATSPRYLFVDFTAPVVRLAAPGNNTTWTAVGNLSFIYNVSDYSSISFCNLSINGVVNQSTTSVPKDVNQTFNVSLPNGLYNWSVNCTDAAGNNGFSGAFNVSVSIPSFNVSLNSPANMTVTSDNSSDYNFTVLGNMASYSCILYLNGVNKGSNTSVLNNTGTVITSSEVADGIYTWQVNCSYGDTYNHSAVRTITIDATSPALNFTAPTAENGTTISINWTQVNISVSEATTNLSSFIFNWNGTNYSIYDSSLVLALNFNNNSALGENATKAVDLSVYSSNCTIYNSPNATWTTSGRYSGAMGFNGTNGYLDCGIFSNLNFLSQLTIKAWVRSTVGGGYIAMKTGPLGPVYKYTYAFTPCGQSGKTGPSQAQCDSAYSGTSVSVTVGGGIQNWTVPYAGTYRINASGAQGGYDHSYAGQKGASITGDVNLTAGEVIRILVGQMGENGSDGAQLAGGGGGGGTYVVRASGNAPIIIAGGGGGAGDISQTGGEGQSGADGTAGYSGAAGGTGGAGGSATTNKCGGGAGWTSAGGSSTYGGKGGSTFSAGGAGGDKYGGSDGGFGGGGGSYYCGGGGGGYSGGGGGGGLYSSWEYRGGGGGSYNNGTNQVNVTGVRSGDGLVTLTLISTNAFSLDTSNNGWFQICNGTDILNASAPSSINDGVWRHLAGTYNGSLISLYINGELVSSNTVSGNITASNNSLLLGQSFNGTIDELRIYNRALSAQEVWLHYQSEFQKYNSTTYRFYSNLTNLTSGTYTYYGWANDSAGNSAYTNTYSASSPRYLNLNLGPSVSGVVVNDSDGGSVQLSVNDDLVVYCNATVSDQDGYQDVFSLGSVNATLHHQSSSAGAGDDKNVHYTNTSCSYANPSGTSATAVCAFTLEHESLNGTWTCTVTAKDSLGSTVSATGTNTVDQLVAVEISESWIHFGVMGLGSSSSVANSTNVSNKGNVVIDLQVAGNADMSCTVGSLGVGNISYNLSSGAYATMSANKLSTSLSSALDFNLAPEGTASFGEDEPATNLTYWTIHVPSYGVRGECNNTVTIAGVISAG